MISDAACQSVADSHRGGLGSQVCWGRHRGDGITPHISAPANPANASPQGRLTEVPEVVGAKGEGERNGVDEPSRLDNGCAENEEKAGYVDVVNVLARKEGVVRHCVLFFCLFLLVLLIYTLKKKEEIVSVLCRNVYSTGVG